MGDEKEVISSSKKLLERPQISSEVVILNDDDDDDQSTCEIISVSSADNEHEMKWRNRSRLNALLAAGYRDPQLLLTRIFGIKSSALPSNSGTLWNILLSILSDLPQRKRLKQYSTIDSVIKLMQERSHILVLTGAGISVSCGIPDFRSRDGVYARLAKDYPDLNSPQNMFEMNFFMKNPYPFFKFAKELFPGQFKPSYAHRFIKLLERKGKLLRNYTQNIDTLEQITGITKTIQCHGSFATASCVTCHHQVPGEAIREAIMDQRVPRCPQCCPGGSLIGGSVNGSADFPPAAVEASKGNASSSSIPTSSPIFGVMKPDIVFFGEGLPYEFHASLQEDVHQADLVLVMGSSLKVRPVSHIPDSVSSKVPRILINRESLSNHTFDSELLGDCDKILMDLCSRLGWDVDENSGNGPTGREIVAPLTEVHLSVPLTTAIANRLIDSDDLQVADSCVPTITAVPGCGGDKYSTMSDGSVPCPTSSPVESKSIEVSRLAKNKSGDLVAGVPPDSAEPNPLKADEKITPSPIHDANDSSIKSDKGMQSPVRGSSQCPINVDENSISDYEWDSDDSSLDDDKVMFNLADFLPENSFTHVPPNQYVYDGAELPFDYETAEDYLQSQGQDDRLDEGVCPVSITDSSTSDASNHSSNSDIFMQRLLRRCEMDEELARHRELQTSGTTADLEVIDCDSSSGQRVGDDEELSKSKNVCNTQEETKDLPKSVNGRSPETKRRKCNKEPSVIGDK